MSRKPPRSVLVGMGETAGWCGGLVAGLREAGVRADHLDLGPDRLRYATDAPPAPVRLVRWLHARRRGGPGPRAAWAALHRVAMAWLFLVALARYDAFVFRAGDSFFNLRDLPLLRRLGRPVVVVFFGSDSRPPYLNGAEAELGRSGTELAAETAARRRMVERIEREAAAVVCHVMSAQLHSRRAVSFLAIGIPRPPLVDPTPPAAARSITALHAPSHTAGKGTALIREAVAAARAAGTDIELAIVAGRPNAEVLAAIERCHFVIDQAYSDTPMAAFATEAAARGRPAVVGGLGWDELRSATADDDLPPSQLCRPEELAAAVTRLATDASEREELAERARRFVSMRWSPLAVAERMLRLLGGDVPEEWTFDPASVAYPYGAGLSEAGVAAATRAVLEATGVGGLRVGDKPELERRLVALASEAAASESAADGARA